MRGLLSRAFRLLFDTGVSEVRAAGAAAALGGDRRLAAVRWVALGGAALLLTSHVLAGAAMEVGVAGAEAVWRSNLLRVDRDLSIPEVFELTLMASAAAALTVTAAKTRTPAAAGLAFAFCALVADNGLQLHERFGAIGPTGSQHANEMVAFGLLGLGLAAATSWSIRASAGRLRGKATLCVVLLAGAAVFAVIVDAAHGWVGKSLGRGVHMVFALAEDGGELICIAAAVCAAASLVAAIAEGEAEARPRERRSDLRGARG
ncbi:MAG: hypothetical protein AAF676_09545 [Pseudomonadota bacterium]